MKKILSFAILLSGLIFILIGINEFELLNINHYGEEVILKGPVTKKLKLSFIGDSLLASFKGEKSYQNFQDLLETHDYNYPYKKVKHIFESDDFTIANGENVFSNDNLLPIEKNYSPAYWYISAKKYANIYKESSIEIVSLMNNHTYDYGNLGYKDTISALKEANVIPGLEQEVVISKDGFNIGIICCNLFHEFQKNQVIEKIKNLKDKVNYIIIYFHGGEEYQYKPTDDIKRYAHNFVDYGADLVIGCHPHVIQPIEVYQGKTIVYSLGSFLFGGTTTLLNRTIIFQVELEFDSKFNIIKQDNTIIPCYLYSSKTGYEKWQPDIITNYEEKQKVIDFMNSLRSTPD